LKENHRQRKEELKKLRLKLRELEIETGNAVTMLEYHQQWVMLKDLMRKSNFGILKKS